MKIKNIAINLRAVSLKYLLNIIYLIFLFYYISQGTKPKFLLEDMSGKVSRGKDYGIIMCPSSSI